MKAQEGEIMFKRIHTGSRWSIKLLKVSRRFKKFQEVSRKFKKVIEGFRRFKKVQVLEGS